MENSKQKKVTSNNQSDKPWINGAVSRRTISMLTLTNLMALGSASILGLVAYKSLNSPPILIENRDGIYVSSVQGKVTVTRDDVEQFARYIIPQLHGASNGEIPGLKQIGNLINPNIMGEQERFSSTNINKLNTAGITQFAIVNAIKPETMVINRDANTIYCEAVGLIGLTDNGGKARTFPTKWRMLMYMVDIIPVTDEEGKITENSAVGNERGIYLHQIHEVDPEEVSDNSPKPTQMDVKEREAQLRKRDAFNNLNK